MNKNLKFPNDILIGLCNNQYILKEKGINHLGKKFTMEISIQKTNIQFSLFKFCPTKDMNIYPYFKDIDNLKSICDYFIFCNFNNYLIILAVELKKGNKKSEAFIQLEASNFLIKFILSSAKRIKLEFTEQVLIAEIYISEKLILEHTTTLSKKYKYTKYDDENYKKMISYLSREFILDEIVNFILDNKEKHIYHIE